MEPLHFVLRMKLQFNIYTVYFEILSDDILIIPDNNNTKKLRLFDDEDIHYDNVWHTFVFIKVIFVYTTFQIVLNFN